MVLCALAEYPRYFEVLAGTVQALAQINDLKELLLEAYRLLFCSNHEQIGRADEYFRIRYFLALQQAIFAESK